MTYQPNSYDVDVQSFAVDTLIIPDDWDNAKNHLVESSIKNANAINSREIARYGTSETITGQKFYFSDDPGTPRETVRKVLEISSLPNTTTTAYPHDIDVTSSTIFTRIFGVAMVAGSSYLPLPHSASGGNYIQLEVTATDLEITTGADRTSYSAKIILEYIR